MRDEFMITRQGKQYVLFAGLLDEAHSRGLRGIATELIQVPDEQNASVAVIKATVEMEDGRTFSGIGDASPENVGRAISPHLIRMAETRAKARALRDAVNVGAAALEELSDAEVAPPAQQVPTRSSSGGPTPLRRQQRQRRSGTLTEGSAGPDGGSSSGGRASDEAKARKSQVDLLKTLAQELRGENGVERLEARVGKPLAELTRAQADEWIDRMTPEDRAQGV